MMFLAKTVGVAWRRRLAVCALLIVVAVGCLYRSYANHVQRSQRNTPKTASKLGSSGVSAQPAPALHINSVVQHGHIVEIEGSTEPGAVVMINGETAPTIFGGNAFRHFVGPLPSGTTIITVTSQDEKGGVNTQQIAATID